MEDFRREFTVEEGIKIQTRQLNEWKHKLNAVVYEELHKWAVRHNQHCKQGEDVRRGNSLTNFIENFKNQ